MRRGFSIGKVLGIELYVDWSWSFLFVLLTWSLAAGAFRSWHPDWQLWSRWATAIVASLLFFASIVVHELSHSLVARRRGLKVHRITLFLLGGVSNLEHEPPSPRTELTMAAVGPVASLALGGLLILIGHLVTPDFRCALANPALVSGGGLSPLATVLAWVGPANVAIGIFNLIPSFPMDGGRILRAILWRGMKNLRRASRAAATVSKLIAGLFMVTGALTFLGSDALAFGPWLVSGLWLMLIGWFLMRAADLSYHHVVVRDLLEDVPVSRLMRSDPSTVPPDLPVGRLVFERLMSTDERAFPVVRDEHLVGMVSFEDVRTLPRDMWDSITVAEIMTPSDRLATSSPQQDASEALDKLTRRDIRQLPVLEDGRLVGVLRRRDIVKWLQMQSELEAA